MPQFDESFLSDCALAERWRFYSYTVKQQQTHVQDEPQQQQKHHPLPPRWSARDNNNNNSNSSSSSSNNNNISNKTTLHDIKFHRRRKYKKLPRLALSTTTATPATPTTSSLTPQSAPCLLVKNVLLYGSISSPSTPSGISGVVGVGGCGSSSNNSINSVCTYTGHSSSSSTTPPPPTTPQSGTGRCVVPPAPPNVGASGGGGGGAAGSSGHKNSLKGTKLARRARSFKDDLIEKISLMRTTNNTLGRSHSPHSPRTKHGSKAPPTTEEVQRSTQTLETHVKDISNALKHFRDVILKKKLEVLPGNGTVILETIASMYSVIQSYTLNENSAIMSSATQQVYQSLGKLIKLCDEVMLSEKSGGECASLSNENVREVIDLLEDAVRNLVTLAQGKLKEQDAQFAFRYSGSGLGGIGAAADIMGAMAVATASSASMVGVGVGGGGAGVGGGADAAAAAAAVAQRTSLPDIGLTPKERDILEQSNTNPMRGSHSTESILRDTSPPPKPPLPNRSSNPPPLPPKRRSQPQQQQQQQQQLSQANSPLPYAQTHNISINSDLDCSSNFSLLNYGVDRLSVRSRSPDENSQCSFDSALNHSRDEEEQLQLQLQKPPIRAQQQQQQQLQMDVDDVDKLISYTPAPAPALAPVPTPVPPPLPATAPPPLPVSAPPAELSGVAVVVAAAPQSPALVEPAGSTSSAPLVPLPLPAAVPVGPVVGAIAVPVPAPSAIIPPSPTTTTAEAADACTELRGATAAALINNRHSNESGFVSMMSFRTSSHSVSKRSSEHSVQSSTKSSSSNSELAFSNTSETTSSSSSSSTTTTTASRSNSSNEYQQMSQTQSTQRHISSSSSSTCSNTTATTIGSEQVQIQVIGGSDGPSSPELAPALPPKTQQRSAMSRFDAAMDELDDNFEMPELRTLSPNPPQHHSSSTQLNQWHAKHYSMIEPPRSAQLPNSCVSAFDCQLDKPPPLPIKKKHILAYMEICSANSHSLEQHRHTMHAYNISRSMSHSQTLNTSSLMTVSKELSTEMETPPALPPKNYKQRKPSSTPAIMSSTPPASPKPNNLTTVSEEHVVTMLDEDPAAAGATDNNENVSGGGGNTFYCHSHQLPSGDEKSTAAAAAEAPINTPKVLESDAGDKVEERRKSVPAELQLDVKPEQEPDDDEREDGDGEEEEEEEEQVDNQLPNMLEEIDITPYLILKNRAEDGPEVKAGYIDALIVHASRVQKVSDNAFSEAFITTFRTFIQPIDVIEKLTHRYTYFFCQVHDQKQKAAKETFSLLVRVVNDLTSTDLTSQLLSLLVEFVYQLVCSGQLYLAKLLRNKFVEKVTLYKDQRHMQCFPAPDQQLSNMMNNSNSGGSASTNPNLPSLLDLKSLEIAEQMTLLDAELFQKIEIPEVLLFAKDQCEEKSPNLNKFTEHFNKMSYWARSKILRLPDAKEREKHVNKFIKIMKHLRKMNNYNSYLALLSALDSGPIRRLEWQKSITEEVRSFCALIDSSSSFRAYRQALAETNPPCIPYIGLVLQDLTFVHVGNQDYVSKGVINFSKRWQQYNIIVNMKRFKKCAYPFRRNERIIGFFENFKDFMGEEEMWQISERLKPRGRRH